MSLGHFNETGESENTEDRKAEAEKQIQEYNDRLDKTLREHGEMIHKDPRYADMDPLDKSEMQAEMQERAEKAKAEFREEMEKKYPELKEGGSEEDLEKQRNDIGDEL